MLGFQKRDSSLKNVYSNKFLLIFKNIKFYMAAKVYILHCI